MNRPAPRDAAFAREIIREHESAGRKVTAIRQSAKLIIRIGNYTPEGLAVWQDYLDRTERDNG